MKKNPSKNKTVLAGSAGFIAFEGIDGSGKATQTKLLLREFKRRGQKAEKIDFPQYGEKSSGLVEEYLRGDYGSSKDVGAYRASIFYACDRYAASFKIKNWLRRGRAVIVDRYVFSNAGHQGGKIKDKRKRKEFFKWLYNLEYGIFGIPKPDVTILLKVTPDISFKLTSDIKDKEKKKRKRSFLGRAARDIHEKDEIHLRSALKSYSELSRLFPEDFKVIDCVKEGKIIPPEEIHEKIKEIIFKKH